MHGPVVRSAARIAEWEIGEQETGDTALFDDITGAPNDDGGKTDLLQVAGNQTHGLVTDRSEGNQQHQVDTVLAAPATDLFGVGHGEALAVAGGDTEETTVGLPDPALVGGLGQGLKGKV